MAWSLQALPELSEAQFEQWSKLLEERTGIQLASRQRPFLQTQIAMRMREVGYEDYGRYFDEVVSGEQSVMEWSRLVDQLVVKETSFFRHRPSIEYVRDLLQERINNQDLSRSFDVWSVGCATGEEPYSLAMVINDCFELAALDPYYGITATDISLLALGQARQGDYTVRKLEQLKPQERQRYFRETEGGHYRIDAALRDRLCFSQGNILQITDMPVAKMDVIFCQNLLVYFRRWRRRELLNAFVERLKPGGVLVIGLGEVVDWEHQYAQRVRDKNIQAYIRSRAD
ncbi:protein-glutamate O-methyltransferase CheR [Exilibacterium tricleocarpae]|uniref:protein-glutamate O-methyltransferase n=1 Tax=Exilibacterium tricleocarpae TaxID=2591008 RepID=A0A545SXE8_9GAMM|nr:protein-glutamate O-methyltransferase CheR [Exilibacterium tricleocarpae]TQV69636.1 protein-glutamate O-methyltransferase CheR [Exilibacterium tricleocarpae]